VRVLVPAGWPVRGSMATPAAQAPPCVPHSPRPPHAAVPRLLERHGKPLRAAVRRELGLPAVSAFDGLPPPSPSLPYLFLSFTSAALVRGAGMRGARV
jgi:hypothetical protein